ncbi:hypothetical protein HZH66_008070 [Vespula vulgaris]|uniref:Uncharacterized protein n=1 Tax=Vespula vulgaris TaxID=7454 RepID=A0A834JUZ8_VESVU|nr:hypothetical protein HZH66_008070 [Vespula vulgaris]
MTPNLATSYATIELIVTTNNTGKGRARRNDDEDEEDEEDEDNEDEEDEDEDIVKDRQRNVCTHVEAAWLPQPG